MRRSAIAVIAVVLVSAAALAEIPQVIGYQGRITDNTGVPVADGTYTMRFRIYTAQTGGTLLWDSNSQSVALAAGIFDVMLGESPQPALALPFDQDYWLSVQFDGEYQNPRKRLGSVGYAYMASGLVPGTEVTGSVTTGSSSAIAGLNTATSGNTYGLYGSASSTDGTGVYGWAGAATGYTRGVVGVSSSTSGTGVYGYTSATSGTNYGAYAYSPSSDGRGVCGRALSTSGYTYGGYFESASTLGVGVYGHATATSGAISGVYGESASTDGLGVSGKASAGSGYTYGGNFWTTSTSGRGVSGWASATTGATYGVYALANSPSGKAVYGSASAGSGDTYGGRFDAASSGGKGVYGWASATTGTTYGVWGAVVSTAGYGVYYTGGLAGTGTKSCVVKTSQGPTLLYCQESPESWFEDFGRGQLLHGRCHIELDHLFLETVTIDDANPLSVFVQLRGDCRGVYVEEGFTGFDVIELQGGTSSVPFVYRVVAKRKGFETNRLDYCAAAERDSYLYPELRKKELQEYEEERARFEREPRSNQAE